MQSGNPEIITEKTLKNDLKAATETAGSLKSLDHLYDNKLSTKENFLNAENIERAFSEHMLTTKLSNNTKSILTLHPQPFGLDEVL